jgi:hypothetical protein
MRHAARRAGPGTDAQRFGAVLDPARRAHLTRGLPPADTMERAAMTAGLVLQHLRIRRPPSVADALAQPRTDEPGHAQVLYVHRLVIADDLRRELVQPVPPRVRDPGMAPSHLDSGFLPVRRPVAAAAESLLRRAEPALGAAQELRAGDLPAVRQNREISQPQIDADLGVRRGQRISLCLYDEAREVSARRIHDHGDARRIRRQVRAAEPARLIRARVRPPSPPA